MRANAPYIPRAMYKAETILNRVDLLDSIRLYYSDIIEKKRKERKGKKNLKKI